jgi:hypothetical protein
MPQKFIRFHTATSNRHNSGRVVIDGMPCRYISLTQGQKALVWESDFIPLSQYLWYAKWSPDTQTFYACRVAVCADGKKRQVFMHREIIGVEPGDGRTVDHVEPSETLDNRRSNLRIATQGQQCCNQRIQRNNTSGYKGVSLNKRTRKFYAHIQADGQLICLGYRDCARDAYYDLYVPAALKLHGEFARLS